MVPRSETAVSHDEGEERAFESLMVDKVDKGQLFPRAKNVSYVISVLEK